jgi:hypothetical protein
MSCNKNRISISGRQAYGFDMNPFLLCVNKRQRLPIFDDSQSASILESWRARAHCTEPVHRKGPIHTYVAIVTDANLKAYTPKG